MIKIKQMNHEDVPYAKSLTDLEQWGHQEEDFHRLVGLNPAGCFVAWDQHERVGIVTSIIHGSFAFLGNLIVRKDIRARGVGMLLMKEIIARLDKRGVRTIELDGVFRAVETYRLLGFNDKYLSLRFVRPASPCQTIRGQSICRTDDIEGILQFDREKVKVDRRIFLEHLLKQHPDTTYSVVRSAISAYAVTRTRETGVIHIGPLVAETKESASILLSCICTKHEDADLTIGVPSVNVEALEVVLQHGFCHRPPSLRMYRGERVDYESKVYGIISADVG